MRVASVLRIGVVILIVLNYVVALKNCSDLLMGQYFCPPPVIDPHTEQPTTCQPDNSVIVTCVVRDGIDCVGRNSRTNEFEMKILNACRNSTGSNHVTALLLSVFLGITGADRFYIGHFTTGLFKLFSCGFFFLLYVADIVFIALEIIGPADESFYFVHPYGPRSFSQKFTNETSLLLFNCFNCVE